jgi:arylsulfatase A-like enzyme
MKALIIGADSVEPSVIFGNPGLFPTLRKMMDRGAYGGYSAYVQKGYNGSYSSEQNWSSLYTGLPPAEHGITTNNVRGEARRPVMSDYSGLRPFWQVLNENGYTVGLWNADNTSEPIDIDGYAIYSKYSMIETPIENREAERVIQASPNSRDIVKLLDGAPPPRLCPKTLSQQGVSFEELKKSPEFALSHIEKYHFQDALPNFEKELAYYFDGMAKAQRTNPVDVLYFFTPTTDVIAHCSKYCDDNDVQIRSYQLLDKYIGEFVEEFKPEITVFISDHGQENFKELCKSSDPDITREVFAARDDVIWLPNGYIAFEAHNGALLFTYHALYGTFIACGSGIKHTEIRGMRTLDFYPTLLEIFGLLPDNRGGFSADIFINPLEGSKRLESVKNRKKIALIETQARNIMDIVLSELYTEKRFADITVVGDKRYSEVISNNPRVSGFCSFEEYNAQDFDEIYCGLVNAKTMRINHFRIA